MHVADGSVSIPDLISAIKQAIEEAGLSRAADGRDLLVSSIGLTLNAIATRAAGGRIDFKIPVIGTQIQLGRKVAKTDTHTIEVNLVPLNMHDLPELRDNAVERLLCEAIQTIRSAVASAAAGADPFQLRDSSIELTFAVTDEGAISIGLEGELTSEITHTIRLGPQSVAA